MIKRVLQVLLAVCLLSAQPALAEVPDEVWVQAVGQELLLTNPEGKQILGTVVSVVDGRVYITLSSNGAPVDVALDEVIALNSAKGGSFPPVAPPVPIIEDEPTPPPVPVIEELAVEESGTVGTVKPATDMPRTDTPSTSASSSWDQPGEGAVEDPEAPLLTDEAAANLSGSGETAKTPTAEQTEAELGVSALFNEGEAAGVAAAKEDGGWIAPAALGCVGGGLGCTGCLLSPLVGCAGLVVMGGGTSALFYMTPPDAPLPPMDDPEYVDGYLSGYQQTAKKRRAGVAAAGAGVGGVLVTGILVVALGAVAVQGN